MFLLQPQANRSGRKARETGWPGLGFSGRRPQLSLRLLPLPKSPSAASPCHVPRTATFPYPMSYISDCLTSIFPKHSMWAGALKNKLSPKNLVCPSAESVSSRHSLTFKSDLLLEALLWGPPPPMFRKAKSCGAIYQHIQHKALAWATGAPINL